MGSNSLPILQEPVTDEATQRRASLPWANFFQGLFQSRSRWTAYSPTVGHLTGLTLDCAYVQQGKATALRIAVIGTSDAANPTFTLPANVFSTNQSFSCYILTGGVFTPGWAEMSALNTIKVGFYDNRAFVAATSYKVVITGVYEAA